MSERRLSGVPDAGKRPAACETRNCGDGPGMKRSASAVWQGSLKEGKGTLTAPGGALKNTEYSFGSRFASGAGTNPEELIAAAHAGCFTMQLAFLIQRAGLAAEELTTEAAVSLVPDGEGFKIDRSALTLQAKVPGINQVKFDELARMAEKNCPVSRLLNAEITLQATLIS